MLAQQLSPAALAYGEGLSIGAAAKSKNLYRIAHYLNSYKS